MKSENKKELINVVFSTDSTLDMMNDLMDKAKVKSMQSDDEDFKMIVNQFEIINDRLINYELPKLYALAASE